MTTTFLLAHDGTEPFATMAENLCKSIHDKGAGDWREIVIPPNGGHYLVEFFGGMYPIFSQAITQGPVVVLDADCTVNLNFDHLFVEKEFVIAAVHRGACSNEMGKQDFLGSLMAFHPHRAQAARVFWMKWMARTCDYYDAPLVPTAAMRHDNLAAKGWSRNWYGGQTAYNDLLRSMEKKDKSSVLRLDRDKYAAKITAEDAYVYHAKGHRAKTIVVPGEVE